MDEKTKLPPEEAEQKIENIRKNLMTRVYAIYREDRTGSIETRKSYLALKVAFAVSLPNTTDCRTSRMWKGGICGRMWSSCKMKVSQRPTLTQHSPASAFTTGEAGARIGCPRTKTCIWKSAIPES